jgi:hypothetical protein
MEQESLLQNDQWRSAWGIVGWGYWFAVGGLGVRYQPADNGGSSGFIMSSIKIVRQVYWGTCDGIG